MAAFFTLEGIECSGKTTQLARIATVLRERGCGVLEVREPGSSAIGERIRELVKDPAFAGTMDPLTSLFLFNAARRQFIKEIVLPALARGEVVLSDRSFLSTIVFQGYAEGIDIDFVRNVCAQTVGACIPDKVFLLDIGTKEMKRRLAERAVVGGDRYDEMDVSFHESVREGYLAEWERDKERILRINGERSVGTITEDILQKMLPLLS